mmetsp:Transcript_60268/g.67377  ORF Transcript_60268/g.67377 Transcript_60268/m.67377 type:complete len:365 (-) Transcript_60268:165-1259(-)
MRLLHNMMISSIAWAFLTARSTNIASCVALSNHSYISQVLTKTARKSSTLNSASNNMSSSSSSSNQYPNPNPNHKKGVVIGMSMSSSDYFNEDDNDDDNDNVIHQLSKYHPIFVEGMGYYDQRDPTIVAQNVFESLQLHFAATDNNTANDDNGDKKPYIIIIQGDPKSERGISAITPIVANKMGCSRGLVCFDHELDPTHSQNADRENVVLELQYSQLVKVLLSNDGGDDKDKSNNNKIDKDDDDNNDDNNDTTKTTTTIMDKLENSIETLINVKNQERVTKLNKPQMKSYYKQYAMLQEVTKASIRQICHNECTFIHTIEQENINPYSCTSFYTVGIQLGLINPKTDIVLYHDYNDNANNNKQ